MGRSWADHVAIATNVHVEILKDLKGKFVLISNLTFLLVGRQQPLELTDRRPKEAEQWKVEIFRFRRKFQNFKTNKFAVGLFVMISKLHVC